MVIICRVAIFIKTFFDLYFFSLSLTHTRRLSIFSSFSFYRFPLWFVRSFVRSFDLFASPRFLYIFFCRRSFLIAFMRATRFFDPNSCRQTTKDYGYCR